MLEVGGQPIIAFNLAMLGNSVFRDVVINLHHLPDAVRAYVGNGERWGLRVTYSEEPVLLGTAGALVPVEEAFAKETFALIFGDNVNDIDLDKMLVHHRKTQAEATVAVWERDDVQYSGVAEVDDQGRIRRFVEKPTPGETASHWINAGVVLLEPSVYELLSRSPPSDLGRDIFPKLLERDRGVWAYPMNGAHYWFDRAVDYLAARDDDALLRIARRFIAGTRD
jgi:NDP-sugar pyrophosphorylase family protein